MALIDQYQLAQDGEFRGRVQQALLTSAVNVMAEATDEQNGPTFVQHQQRANFAQRVLNNPNAIAKSHAFAIASNPAITDQSTDNDLQFTVNSMWNAFSGVSANAVEPV